MPRRSKATALFLVSRWNSLIELNLENTIIEGSLEVKLPTIWTDEKQSREKRKIRRKKSRRERVRRKKIQMREKVEKSRNTVFFQWFGAPEGRRSRLAKAAGAEPAGQMRDEKLHAVVARSTFGSQKVKNTRGSDHFWKLRCRKSARRCGAKHISKSKMHKTHQLRATFGSCDVEKVHAAVARSTFRSQNATKHTSSGPLLEVAMSKKCTPLRRHFEVKMHKTHQLRTTFGSWDVEKVHAVVARSTFRSQNVQNTTCSRHFWRFQMSKKCTPLWREAHFEVKMLKAPGVRTTFRHSDVEKVHAVVTRSTFWSQNVKNTRGSDHFWRLRCRFASLH